MWEQAVACRLRVSGLALGYADAYVVPQQEESIFAPALARQEIQAIFNAGAQGKCKCGPPISMVIPNGQSAFMCGCQVAARLQRQCATIAAGPPASSPV